MLSILHTLSMYNKKLISIQDFEKKNIWINPKNPFNQKKHKNNEFKILFTTLNPKYVGGNDYDMQQQIQSLYVQKIKAIIPTIYSLFEINLEKWYQFLNATVSIQDVINTITQLKNPDKIKPITQQNIVQIEKYINSQAIIGFSAQFGDLLQINIRNNLTHWIIKSRVYLEDNILQHLGNFIREFKLEVFDNFSNMWKQNENCRKLKIFFQQNGYLNSLERFQQISLEEIQQFQASLLPPTAQINRQIIQQKQQYQDPELSKYFPNYSKQISFLQGIPNNEMLNVVNCFSKKKDLFEERIAAVIQIVVEKLSAHYKMQTLFDLQKQQNEIRNLVLINIDEQLVRLVSNRKSKIVGDFEDTLNGISYILNTTKQFYSQILIEQNKVIANKLQYEDV